MVQCFVSDGLFQVHRRYCLKLEILHKFHIVLVRILGEERSELVCWTNSLRQNAAELSSYIQRFRESEQRTDSDVTVD